jgi:lipoprotein-anchoring transpeptidase ErfK/SrfK
MRAAKNEGAAATLAACTPRQGTVRTPVKKRAQGPVPPAVYYIATTRPLLRSAAGACRRRVQGFGRDLQWLFVIGHRLDLLHVHATVEPQPISSTSIFAIARPFRLTLTVEANTYVSLPSCVS